MPFWLEPYSDAVGVGGKEEHAIPLVRGAHGRRGDMVPFRSPAARGQRLEDFPERVAGSCEQSRDVLDEEPPGFRLLDDAPALTPEPSLVVGAEPLTGEAIPLARDARTDEIHDSTEASAWEGREIVPDRCRVHGTLFHTICDDACSVGLPLDNTHKL